MEILDNFINWASSYGATSIMIWAIGYLFTLGAVSLSFKRTILTPDFEGKILAWLFMFLFLIILWPIVLGYCNKIDDR